MSELKPCDFLGNEICVGDEAAFFALGYRMFTRGVIVKITPKCVFIDYDNSWNYSHHEEHTRQEQRQLIDLTALNLRAQPANEPKECPSMVRVEGGIPYCSDRQTACDGCKPPNEPLILEDGFEITNADGSPIDYDALGRKYKDQLCYCDIDGFYLGEDGQLVLMDDCGSAVSVDRGDYHIIARPPEGSGD